MKSLEQLTNDLLQELFDSGYISKIDSKEEYLIFILNKHLGLIINDLTNDYNQQINEQSLKILELENLLKISTFIKEKSRMNNG